MGYRYGVKRRGGIFVYKNERGRNNEKNTCDNAGAYNGAGARADRGVCGS